MKFTIIHYRLRTVPESCPPVLADCVSRTEPLEGRIPAPGGQHCSSPIPSLPSQRMSPSSSALHFCAHDFSTAPKLLLASMRASRDLSGSAQNHIDPRSLLPALYCPEGRTICLAKLQKQDTLPGRAFSRSNSLLVRLFQIPQGHHPLQDFPG